MTDLAKLTGEIPGMRKEVARNLRVAAFTRKKKFRMFELLTHIL